MCADEIDADAVVGVEGERRAADEAVGRDGDTGSARGIVVHRVVLGRMERPEGPEREDRDERQARDRSGPAGRPRGRAPLLSGSHDLAPL